MFMLEV